MEPIQGDLWQKSALPKLCLTVKCNHNLNVHLPQHKLATHLQQVLPSHPHSQATPLSSLGILKVTSLNQDHTRHRERQGTLLLARQLVQRTTRLLLPSLLWLLCRYRWTSLCTVKSKLWQWEWISPGMQMKIVVFCHFRLSLLINYTLYYKTSWE